MKSLNIKEALYFGWGVTKSNFWLFAGVFVTMLIGNMLVSGFASDERASVFFTIIGFVLRAYLSLGLIIICLKVVDGKKFEYRDLFADTKLFWPYLLASVIVQVAVMIGFVLLIVPGVILALALMFYGMLMVDKKFKPIDSLKESMRITKGYKWQLFGMSIVFGLVNIAGALVFGIGLLWTIPTTAIAITKIYRQLV